MIDVETGLYYYCVCCVTTSWILDLEQSGFGNGANCSLKFVFAPHDWIDWQDQQQFVFSHRATHFSETTTKEKVEFAFSVLTLKQPISSQFQNN